MQPEPALDIDETLRQIASGNREAFAAIVAHFQRPLFGFLSRLGLSSPQAEELAQEAFLKAWRSLATYRADRGAFSTWLFTIARNLAIDELSRVGLRPERASHQPVPDVEGDTPEPLQLMISAQRSDQLRQALRRLPMVDRSALALVYVNELDIEQVARIEGCTPGALKVRLHRARQKLRTLLEQEDGGSR